MKQHNKNKKLARRSHTRKDLRPETTYVLPNLPLATPSVHEHALQREHAALHILKNTLIRHVRAELAGLERDKKYRTAKRTIAILGKELENEKKKQPKHRDQAKIARLKKHIKTAKDYTRTARAARGLTKNDIEKRLNVQRKQQYAKIVGSDAGQKCADAVWQSVEKYLYGKGGHIHYEKWSDPHSISGKSKNSGVNLYYKHGKPAGIIYRKRVIPFRRALNAYETEALKTGDVRYLEVYPIQFANETHWYTRVILYGRVPSKGKRLSRAVGGADIGTSTVAFASPTLVEMRVLGGEPKHYDAQIRELSRRIDESTRATNPNNYNDDGTIKKRYRDTSGVLVPLSWVVSSHCRALQAKRRALYRKKALSLRQSHCEVANLMARHAGIIYTEKMNWAGLAKRAARRTDEKTGREKARARFGKSIGSHAPALFEKVLAWRLFALGGELRYVNTFSFRASQLDHITGECVKTRLGQRSKVIGGVTVQRDMYSAFLLWHSRSDSASADRAWCVEDFARYVALERGFRARAVGSGLCRNACFGF